VESDFRCRLHLVPFQVVTTNFGQQKQDAGAVHRASSQQRVKNKVDELLQVSWSK